MKISALLIGTALSIAMFGGANAAGFGPATGASAILGAPTVTLGATSGTESYNSPAFIFATTGSLMSATGSGSVLGTLSFSDILGTTTTESVPSFLQFADSSGGEFVFNVASVQTLAYSNQPSTTNIALYLLGTAGDTTLGLTPSPTSVTITANQTGGSAYSASASIASPPALTSAAPEPSTWAMMLAGFGMIGGLLRLRTKGFALAA